MDAVVQAFRDTRDPGRYAIRSIQVDGVPVVAIAVAKRVNGFAQTSSGRVLARRGSAKAPLFGDELRRLVVERSLERFEEHDTGVSLDSASRRHVERLADVCGWSRTDELETRLRERGLLAAGQDPRR